MERISSFKDFNSIYVERNQQITVEENENKRNAIADRVKTIMSAMEISKLTDLDEDTKLKFVETLFSQYSLNYKNHITEKAVGQEKVGMWSADLSHLQKELGKVPKKTIFDTCENILRDKYQLNVSPFGKV